MNRFIILLFSYAENSVLFDAYIISFLRDKILSSVAARANGFSCDLESCGCNFSALTAVPIAVTMNIDLSFPDISSWSIWSPTMQLPPSKCAFLAHR